MRPGKPAGRSSASATLPAMPAQARSSHWLSVCVTLRGPRARRRSARSATRTENEIGRFAGADFDASGPAMSKLHLVFGGLVKDPQRLEFVDLQNMDLVGLFDSYAAAEDAWRGAAQRTV